MKSFTRIISETLKTAEERATAVSRMLTENTSTATKGVIENFETLNRTATTESRKAAEAVREANKAMIGEIGQAITEATRRFGEATREMRTATQDLQRDLNVTRDEVRRGVLELPEEAREGAEAMRRVVSEQIRALSELSEIINRHGKTLDLSSPSLGEPRAYPAVGYQAAVGADVLAAPAVRFAEPQGNGGSTQPMVAKVQPRAVPRSAPAANRNPSAGEDAGEGWVSDLLRRASTDDEPSATPVAAEPAERRRDPAPATAANGAAAPAAAQPQAGSALNVISADIARAIDHEAAVELWARHAKGERNLFTRRLYTLPGQQTFDEIRKKYQKDGDFRTAVDRYVTDFEKLLAEVTRTGKDRAAGNAYLTSDTGKVYTMLAHASGRFD
jgi:hypothetical protein